MNRLHVHLNVRDIDETAKFYTALFGIEPTRREADYAKWMLDDPQVNFAISARGGDIGVDHLGIQVDSEDALEAVSGRAKTAAGQVLIEREATCCYAKGNKAWAEDPQGIRWETFHTSDNLTVFGEGAKESHIENKEGAHTAPTGACCA